jgi:hypothetical protein
MKIPLEKTRAWKLYQDSPPPWTQADRRAIAQAFLDDERWGDIPAEVVHHFSMTAENSADLDAVIELVNGMRSEHFAKLGKAVPEYAIKYR